MTHPATRKQALGLTGWLLASFVTGGIGAIASASGSGIGLDQGASILARNRGAVATNLFGNLTLAGFSSAVLRDDSGVNGNLTCVDGSNVACTDPSKVAGTSNCSLCPK